MGAEHDNITMVDIQRLRRFSIFDSLSDEELTAYQPAFFAETRPRNEVIYRQGEPGERFYMIEAGQVSATRREADGEHFLGYFGAGEIFGADALLKNTTRSATVDVVLQVSLIYLEREDFLYICETHPQFRAAVEAIAGRRAQRRVKTFPGRRLDEAVVVATHRHLLWLLIRLVPWSLLLVAWLAITLITDLIIPWWAHLIFFPIFFAGAAWFYFDWQNDWFIVSSRRVIHRESVIFFFEREEEAQLDKVQSVDSNARGVIGSWLNFGDVIVHTAAGGGRIVFDFVPKFREIRDAIQPEVQRVQERHKQEEYAQLRQSIRRELMRELTGVTEAPPPAQPKPAVAVQEQPGALKRFLGGLNFMPPTRLQKGEQIIWRKHVLLLIGDIIWPIFALIGLMIFTFYMIFGDLVGLRLPLPIALIIAVVGTLAIVFWLWYRYTDWENDIYVLTPDRLIDSERKPLWLQEKVKTASLAQVQNVNFERNTILENIFDFGTVKIDTAGEQGELTFDEVPNPREVQALISDATERFRERQRQRERDARRREILEIFGEYHRLLTEEPPL